MAGFGGAVKLTGESEYRKALQSITQSLKEVDSELKLVASQYGKNDNSQEALSAKTDALTKKLTEQNNKVKTLSDNLKDLEQKAEANAKKHEELKNALEAETQKLEQIGKECGKNSEEYKAQAKVVSDLSATYKKSSDNIDGQAATLSKARTELNNAKAAAKETEREVDNLSESFSDVGDAAEDAGNKAEKSSKGGWTVLKGILSDLASNVIQDVLSGLRDLVGEAIDAADALNKFETTMGFAGFDESQIQKAREAVKDYADKTVYELDTISNTTAQLAANGIEDFTGLTQAAGNLNAVAGGNADTFSSVAMVLTQTAGAGKLTTENWNQLANAIPGASGVIQKALKDAGAYTGDFREAMAKGEITADEFNKAIMELGSDPVAVEAAQSVSTFEGAVGNMKASVVSGFLEIYDTIGQENITGFINSITEFINQIIPPLKNAVQWFISNLPVIAPILGGIAGALVGLFVAQKITALVTAFQAWRAATEGQTIAQAMLNAVMNANPITMILGLIGLLIGAITTLWLTNEDFRKALTEAWENIKQVASDVWEGIATFFSETLPNALNDCVENVKQWFNNIVEWIRKIPGKFKEFLDSALSKVGSWATDLMEKGRTAAFNFFDKIVSGIKELPSKVKEKIDQVLKDIGQWGSDIVDKIKELPGEMLSIGKDLVEGLWDGIKSAKDWLWEKLTGFGNGITQKLKSMFGISSPSKLFRDEIGKYLAEGIGVGFSQEMDKVSNEMQAAIPHDFDISTNLKSGSVSGLGNLSYNDLMQASGSPLTGMSFNDLVSAFKEALTGVDVELDDQQVGRFVRKTVTDAIYN